MRTSDLIPEKLNRTESNELVIFDIDDTLLHTTAKINVIKDGEIVRSLSNQEFNNYKLQPGEQFDFGEFRNAEKFEEESIPIGPMLDKLRGDLAAGKNVVMLTARADFDNQKAVWRTFKRHGIDINRDVHLFRAGNISGPQSPAIKKALHVSRWLKTEKYNRVVMYDDSQKNLSVFKKLEKRFPGIEFEAHHVNDTGDTKQVETNIAERRRKKVKGAAYGPGAFGMYGVDAGYSGDGGVAEGKFRANNVEEYKPGKEALNDLKSRYLPDWEMLDHKTLQAKYVAKDHRHAEQFTKFINKLSEKLDHFAEVTQDVAEVAVKTTTFDVKGLTLLDFQLAMIVDNFAEKNDIEQVRMSGNFGMYEDVEQFDREKQLVRKLGQLGIFIVKNPMLWKKYSDAIDSDNLEWIIGLIQDKTGANKEEVEHLAELFGEIGGGGGRLTDFAWAVKEGTWVEDFIKPYIEYKKQSMAENFADGRNPQDKGDSKRHGVPTKASVSTLRKVAKQGGRKGQLAHWMANMKAGKAKKK